MKKILAYIFVMTANFIVSSCGGDTSAVDQNVTFPQEVIAPEGVTFSYLMFENDYNAVPKDGNPANYTADVRQSETSGMSFALTNKKKFLPGVSAIIKAPKVGEWYKVSFACFKPSDVIKDPKKVKGFAIVSYHRGDSTLHYKTYPIDELLSRQNKQFVDKWQTLSVWHEVPSNIQAGDRLKIYHWNPQGGNIYFDDFIVEVWTTVPTVPRDVALSHIVFEQNYETTDLKKQTTKETAARGLYSCILSGAPGKTEFGAGYKGTLAEANLEVGDYVKVSFAALKKHKVRRCTNTSNMVISLARDKQQLFWEGLPIDSRIRKGDKQAYGNWVNIEMWKQIPEEAKLTDFLKIYPWNKQVRPIYIDDLKVEVWKTVAPVSVD
jgi:hypothetical protein